MSAQFVALVRHGDYHQLTDAPSAFQPFPLTDGGRQHALRSAKRVDAFSMQQAIPIDRTIYCSVLLRAWQTAEIIHHKLQGEYTLAESPLLNERCVGSVANLTAATIGEVMNDDPRYAIPPQGWKSDSYFRLPFAGAESLMEAGKRVADYICGIMQPLAAQPSMLHMIVGHGAAFRHAACHLGVLPFEQIAKVSMYHDQPVFLRYDNNQSWHLAGGQWKLRQSSDAYRD